MKKERKYLTTRQFCEIVLDKKVKLPKEINVHRKKKQLSKLFGWFETIRSCNHYNHFQIVSPKACSKIEEMSINEKELLSILNLWKLWKEKPDTVCYR